MSTPRVNALAFLGQTRCDCIEAVWCLSFYRARKGGSLLSVWRWRRAHDEKKHAAYLGEMVRRGTRKSSFFRKKLVLFRSRPLNRPFRSASYFVRSGAGVAQSARCHGKENVFVFVLSCTTIFTRLSAPSPFESSPGSCALIRLCASGPATSLSFFSLRPPSLHSLALCASHPSANKWRSTVMYFWPCWRYWA
nr:hypothetical protein [Pandoravirus massiliensis]